MKRMGKLGRSGYGLIAVLLTAICLLPAFGGTVFAYGQVTSRSIEMSSSAPSATGTSYAVSFTTATTSTVAGIVVDFCSNDPIISDACTAPTGFTVGTPTVSGQSANISTLTTAASANTGRTLELTGTGASVSASSVVSFTLTTATNPSAANTTFYARIFTFATTGAVTTWASTADGSSVTGVVDAGGIALSTTVALTVTAKVQEQLTFCIYTGANCAAGGTAVALGDTHGVLSSSGPYVDKTTHYDVATNASSGVAIRVQGGTLTAGSFTIAGIASPTTSALGTSQFGMCTYESSGTAITPVTNYNTNCSSTTQTAGTGSTGGVGTSNFYFPTATTSSTYGDVIANATAGASSTGIVAFLGNISLTQQAGIYTTALKFIATGTF